MLTSPGNQYLRPEYLTPLPTTLDAKKSPLALLAQTCSQIGADAPNAKLLQSSSDNKSSKKSESSSSRDKLVGDHHNNHKSSSGVAREKSRTPEEPRSTSTSSSRVRTPSSAPSSKASARCGSNQSAASPRSSPAERRTPGTAVPESASVERTTPKSIERFTPPTPATSTSSSNKTAFTPNILTSSSDPAIKDLPLGTFKPGVVPVSSAFLGGYPTGFPLPMDLMTSSLMSAQHHALKSGLSPYLSYSRMKDSLQGVCRDPYCTGCGVSSHLAMGQGGGKPACPAGCSQCDHVKPPTSTASYLGHSPAAVAYAHAQLAALAAASHLPYVCNWMSGDSVYCGKRFSSSEELLSHLRTHTSASSPEALAGLPPSHPLLHRTYPTPPLSPLATARYHPYSKPSSLLPPSLGSSFSAGFPSLGHPGLPPYLSPYSLYGPRLGAAPGMHP